MLVKTCPAFAETNDSGKEGLLKENMCFVRAILAVALWSSLIMSVSFV